jgi:hypothetical protein
MAHIDEDLLDMIIWNKREAAWYGVPAGKFTRRQVLRAMNDRLAEARRKREAEQG